MSAMKADPAAPTVESLLAAAEKLSHDDRVALRDRLDDRILASDDPARRAYEEAWEKEIKRRLDDYDAGRAKATDMDEFMAQVRDDVRT